ncbi:MAG TPA: porin [Castellaniella sp.]|uniref:porin n=1 Tax=Castellaniella sp. TaxID=1955812 RepID=UPI002EF0BF61
MKKTLLAAALLAGFATAGVAQAETSVTLYGILDTGYGYQNFKYDHTNSAGVATNDTARFSGMRDGFVNGNRWGLKGSEDMGNGLRAIFQLEQGFSIASGKVANGPDNGVFNRQAFVGLASDQWGSLTMGKQYGAGVDTSAADEMNGLGDYDHVFGGVGLGNRVVNSFKYTTPTFSGFKAVVLYGTGGNGSGVLSERLNGVSQVDRGDQVSLGANYTNGPLAAAASYDRQSKAGTNALTSWTISGGYDFEVVKLSGMFGQDRNGKIGWGGDASNFVPDIATSLTGLGAGYANFKSNNWSVTGSAPIGPGRLYLTYSGSHSNLGDADKWGSEAGNINMYAAQYRYPLSKRTTVYAYGGYGTNLGYVKDLKGGEAGIGLNHKF